MNCFIFYFYFFYWINLVSIYLGLFQQHGDIANTDICNTQSDLQNQHIIKYSIAGMLIRETPRARNTL